MTCAIAGSGHPEAEIAEAAIAGFDGLSEADQKLYWDVILNGLPALVRQALEARMIKGYQYQSDFARKYYWQGHDEGLKQGHEEAREELRREIVALVSARLPGVQGELAGRLQGQPEAALLRIAVELAKATDEDGARAALDRTLGPGASRRP